MPEITREWITDYIRTKPPRHVEVMVGKALVALFERQTETEKQTNDTKINNSIGFSGADARSGTITAKSFLKHGRLQDWQVEKWTKPAANGYPRLAKYAKQLNEIAQEKSNDG